MNKPDEFNKRNVISDLRLLFTLSQRLRKASEESPVAMYTALREEVETSALGGFMRSRWEEDYATWLSWDQYATMFGEAFLMGVQFQQEKESDD